MPLIACFAPSVFTGAGCCSNAPSQGDNPSRQLAAERCDFDFWVLCRGQAEPAGSGDPSSQSCHGLRLFSRAFRNRRLFSPSRCAFRSRLSDVPQVAGTTSGSHPLLGFIGHGQKKCAHTNQADMVDFLPRPETLKPRRHPCRRRPFSVLRRPAPS